MDLRNPPQAVPPLGRRMEDNSNPLTRVYISSEARFYTIENIQEMPGWSKKTVQRLFNDPRFPAADYGRIKVVEAHALIDYFSKRHEKDRERHWQSDSVRSETRRR